MKKVQFSKHIRKMRLYCQNTPTKSQMQHHYALYPLNYLPCSPRLITNQLNYIRGSEVTEIIKLENVFMRDTGIIDFTLHVSNLCYSKSVFIRYSIDNWKSHNDIECFYKKSSIASTEFYYGVDEFSAMLDSHKVNTSDNSQLEFALCYRFDHNIIWNNNNGKNYAMEVQIKSIELQDTVETDSEFSDTQSMKSITSYSSTDSTRFGKPLRNRYSFENQDFKFHSQVKPSLPPHQRPEGFSYYSSAVAPFTGYKDTVGSPPSVLYRQFT